LPAFFSFFPRLLGATSFFDLFNSFRRGAALSLGVRRLRWDVSVDSRCSLTFEVSDTKNKFIREAAFGAARLPLQESTKSTGSCFWRSTVAPTRSQQRHVSQICWRPARVRQLFFALVFSNVKKAAVASVGLPVAGNGVVGSWA